MYKKILVALENSSTDESLIQHITEFAKFNHSHLLLVHVAEGWAARHYDDLLLKKSEEMVKDEKYLHETAKRLQSQGLSVDVCLARGEPAEEILQLADINKCDLIAMTSHGHRFFADLLFGTTIEEVRHQSSIPLLIVKGKIR